jgi:putative heme iron utilization protein
MPCDTEYLRLEAEERRRVERERERELERIEQELAAGIAQIVVAADGTVQLLATYPDGMHEACTLAGLQRRNSQGFQFACQTAGVYNVDFVTLHGHSH